MAESVGRKIEITTITDDLVTEITGQSVEIILWLNESQTNNLSLTRREARRLRDQITAYLEATRS